MPTRSQRHMVEILGTDSGGQGADLLPGVLTAFAAAGGVGKATFTVTAGADCNRVNVYEVPTGAALDKNVHRKISVPCSPNGITNFVNGDPSVDYLGQAQTPLERQWSLAAGKYTHANTNLDNRAAFSADGAYWRSGTTLPADSNAWGTVAYSTNLGRLVAVSRTGIERCMTSDDGGVTWTARSIGFTANWKGLTYSPELNLFVVASDVATVASVYTSPDGITWTARPKPTTVGVLRIIWVKELGLFVAVGNAAGTNTHVMTSPDGLVWTARTSPDMGWSGVAWSPELGKLAAVAITGTGPRSMYSSNGIDWTSGTANATFDGGQWRNVCWGAGKFIAVADAGSNRIHQSVDGINWTTTGQVYTAGYSSVDWSPSLGIFAISALSGTYRFLTSPDGTNWTGQSNAPNAQAWNDVCWAGAPQNKFVVVSGANGVSYEKLWWPATVKAGENWRFGATVSDGVTLGTSGAIYCTFGSPGWEQYTLTNSFGAATRRTTKVPTTDQGWVGFAVSTDAAVAISQVAAFRETYLCAPQGIWDYYSFPTNSYNQEGAGAPVVSGVVII